MENAASQGHFIWPHNLAIQTISTPLFLHEDPQPIKQQHGQQEDADHQIQKGPWGSEAVQERIHVLLGTSAQGDSREFGQQKGEQHCRTDPSILDNEVTRSNHHSLSLQSNEKNQIRAAEVAKLVSRAWKDLPDAELEKWIELGRLDRQRYDREKAAYTGPWKVPDIKDPDTPKRPMSAFLAFSNERRKTIVEANPHLSSSEISSVLAKLWRECPLPVKKIYREKEAQQRSNYKKERAAWKQRSAATPEPAMVEETSSGSSVVKSEDSQSEKDSLDMDGFDELMAVTDDMFENEKFSLSALDAICPLDCQRVDNEPISFFPTKPSTSTCNMGTEKLVLPVRADRFENYTMDDILQDDELFEDFSPSQVEVPTAQPVVPRSETYCELPNPPLFLAGLLA